MVMGRKTFVSFWYLLLMVLSMYYLQIYVLGSARPQSISYSEMMHLLESGQIDSIEVDEQYIRGKLKSSVGKKSPYVVTARMDTDLAKLL